jgi:hydrogenase nickel incorporation protein HypA/HybF
MRVAQEIISFSEKEMHERDFQTLKEIGIKVGPLSCIDPDSLRFAFDTLKKETKLSQAELLIEQVNVQAVCQSCGNEFEVNNYIFICPECGSHEVEVQRGEELLITHLIFE